MTITSGQLSSKVDDLILLCADRYIDLAAQLVVYGRDEAGNVFPSGVTSKIYGGRWDIWGNCYSKEKPERVVKFKVGQRQYEILEAAMSKKYHHLLVVGSRRSGKSETLALWFILRMLELPGLPECAVFKKHGKSKKWLERKILPRAGDFMLPGKWGFRQSPDAMGITFFNGSILEFLSSESKQSARGEGSGGAGCDERQIIEEEFWQNTILTMSEASDEDFQTFENGTALQGEFEDYFEEVSKDPGYFVTTMTAYDNPFIGKKFIEDARKHMDPKRYAQEVLAQFAPQGAVVYHQFEKRTHCIPFIEARKTLLARYGHYENLGKDMTGAIASQWFKEDADYIIGMDFNVAPMVSVIFRILNGPPGVGEIWWAIDECILDDRADATRIAIELKKRGYFPAVIIPDASGARSEGGISSHRQLRSEGFKVFAPKKNPAIPDRINAVNTMLFNAASQVRLYIDPSCRSVIKALQNHKYDEKGKPEKEGIHEHRGDALGYPISFFCPVSFNWEKAEKHG